MFKKVFCIFIIITLYVNCRSGQTTDSPSGEGASGIISEKKSGFDPGTKKVSTSLLYNLDTKKFGDKTDFVLNSFVATVDAKISEIYGEGIVGGDALTTLANRLKIQNFDKVIQNLVENQLQGVTLTQETKNSLSTITDKGKIDGIAVPVATGGLNKLKDGQSIDISVVVYNGKNKEIEVLGQYKLIQASAQDLELAKTSPDKVGAAINLTVLSKTNELMLEMRKTLRPGSVKEGQNQVAKSEKEPPKEEKEVPTNWFTKTFTPGRLFLVVALIWLVI